MSIRIVSLLTVGAVAVSLAILAWPQAFGLERSPIVAQVVSLRGPAAIVALPLVVLFVVIAIRARPARALAGSIAMLLVLFAATNFLVLTLRGSGTVQADGSADLVVLEWNTLGGAPGAATIARLALDSDADAVALPETTRDMGDDVAAIMLAAGRPMQVLTVAYDNTSTARSTTLLLSTALGEYDVEAARTTAVLPTVVATPRDGTGPTFLAAHTLAPIPPMMLAWQDDLRSVAEVCSTSDVIIAGDFNATVDNFGELDHAPGAILGNCVDAALAGGSAASGTWPAALPAALGAPIDHVLATPNWRVKSARVIQDHDGDGSDHRPLLVRLVQSN